MQPDKQGPKKRKTFFVMMNVYAEDRDKIKTLAEAEGLSIAEFIHRIASKAHTSKTKRKAAKK
jgi:hypothetical protein